MKIIRSIKEMASLTKKLKEQGLTIALVPTMGALHEGHLSLVSAAKEKTDKVIVSIFVNPIQFGPKEDYKRYPRDFKRDQRLLRPFAPIIIFNPSPKEMYPADFKSYVEVQDLGNKLCGRSRPGHFRGVATIVAKLFNITRPDYAFFGEKDFQQQLIIKKMAKDLNCGTKIISLPTVREYDGLALSSRNSYLAKDERRSAAVLFRSLCRARKLIKSGENNTSKILLAANKIIGAEPSVQIEYLSIVDPETLDEAKTIKGRILIALAARIGKTRLIDNLMVVAR